MKLPVISKKLATTIAAAAILILDKPLGIGLDQTTKMQLVLLIVGYNMGQGLSDLGKYLPIFPKK